MKETVNVESVMGLVAELVMELVIELVEEFMVESVMGLVLETIMESVEDSVEASIVDHRILIKVYFDREFNFLQDEYAYLFIFFTL